jgi:large subunit ribosomal protein L25
VTFEGKRRPHIAILKDHQLDAVRHVVTHVDLQEIRLDEPIDSTVAIVVEGTSVGVKQGGLLDMLTHEVNVHGLPADIPEHVTLDVTSLGIGDHGRVADLVVPDNVTVLDDPEQTICSVLARESSRKRSRKRRSPRLPPNPDWSARRPGAAPVRARSDPRPLPCPFAHSLSASTTS